MVHCNHLVTSEDRSGRGKRPGVVYTRYAVQYRRRWSDAAERSSAGERRSMRGPSRYRSVYCICGETSGESPSILFAGWPSLFPGKIVFCPVFNRCDWPCLSGTKNKIRMVSRRNERTGSAGRLGPQRTCQGRNRKSDNNRLSRVNVASWPGTCRRIDSRVKAFIFMTIRFIQMHSWTRRRSY